MQKYIAYKTVDPEHDHWSETVFLFKTREAVKEFFHEYNPVLIEVFTDDDNPTIIDFEVLTSESSDIINQITFETEYSGEVRIVEMSDGYLIE